MLVPLLGMPLFLQAGAASPVGAAESAAAVVCSPAPNSRTASVDTQISFLGSAADPLRAAQVTVTGSLSGKHDGVLRRYSGGAGVSFLPNKPFLAGETVQVLVPLRVVGAPSGRFAFTVARRNLAIPVVQHHYRTTGPGTAHYVSEPSIAPATVTLKASAATANEGDFFLAAKGAVGQPGPMIVDAAGRLIWFQRLSDPNAYAMNLSVQRYHSQPVLTWWQGDIEAAHGAGEDVIMNTRYKVVAIVHGGNGFAPDLHDLQLNANHAWVTSYQEIQWNLTSQGGAADALVWDGIVQEIDVATGLVMFEWHSLDHVPVSASDFTPSPVASAGFDYFHVNSIDVVSPQQILVSARNTSGVYDVSIKQGGRIAWQLGGTHSTFRLDAGSHFALQHDVRMVRANELTVFDNARSAAGQYSKALVISLDASTKTAHLQRVIERAPPLRTTALGNVESLPDGNLLVSWGTTPYFGEYSPSGALLYEGKVASGDNSYRTYRFAWNGVPATPPNLVLASKHGVERVAVSWNGATGVARWQVASVGAQGRLRPLFSTPARGFQSLITLPSSFSGHVIVRALDARNRVLGVSNAVELSASIP